MAIGEEFGYDFGENLTGKTYAALRRMGFKKVFDTNFGADLTIIEEASEFVERFTKRPESLLYRNSPKLFWEIDHRPHSSCKPPAQRSLRKICSDIYTLAATKRF